MPTNSTTTASPGVRWAYWLWLLAPLGVWLLAGIMSTGNDRTVSFPGLGVLPETCTLHSRLGLDCPGCGLTRSFIHLAHGRFAQAWRLNPIGILMFLYVGLQIPLALMMLVNRRWSQLTAQVMQRCLRWNERTLILLMLALLVQWVVRLTIGSLH